MLNNNMDENGKENQECQVCNPPDIKKPDEKSGVYFESFVKIYDPESQEVYFAGRA